VTARRRDAWTALLLGAGTAAILALFVAPDVGWRDAGELAAATFSVGVAHPTGFPLQQPPGKLTSLLPVGGVALRLNFFMALCAAAAVAALFLAIRAAAGDDAPRAEAPRGAPARAPVVLAAALGALGLLASPVFWLHSLVTEVYVPTALALAAWLAGLLPLLAGPPPERLPRRALALLAFGFGLGLGAHVTFPLVAGAAALPLIGRLLRRPATRDALGRALPGLLLLVAAGALVLVFLPLAASRDPWRNWGDPSTPGRLWEHLTGARIRRMFESEMSAWNGAVLAAHARLYARLVWDNLGPLLLPAAAGAVWLVRRRPAVFAATALGLLADAVFSIRLNPMGLAELQTSVPSYLLLDLWAGVGAVWTARALARALAQRPQAIAAALLALALGLWTPLWLGSDRARPAADARAAAALARQGMNQAPPGAAWVTSSDSLCALTTWLQGAENHRPDLGNLVKQQLWDPVYVASAARADRGAVVPVTLAATLAAREGDSAVRPDVQGQALRTVVDALRAAGRPILWEPGDAILDAPFLAHLAPGFPLWRLRPEAVPLPTLDALREASEPAVDRWLRSQGRLPPLSAELLGHWHRLAATVLSRRGDDATALVVATASTAYLPDDARAWNNLAALRARAGDLPGASAAARHALAADPAYRRAWQNLGGWRALLLDAAGTYEAYAAAARLEPDEAARRRIALDLGRLHARRGEAALGALWLDAALALDPANEEARRLRAGLTGLSSATRPASPAPPGSGPAGDRGP
jgi:tetratricopeptide (TPR) repeat protein